jgi:hypothetical protein
MNNQLTEKAKEREQFEGRLRIYWPYREQQFTANVRMDGYLIDNFWLIYITILFLEENGRKTKNKI